MEPDNLFKAVFADLPDADAGLDCEEHSLGDNIFEKREETDPVGAFVLGKKGATVLQKSAPASGSRLDKLNRKFDQLFAGHPEICAEMKEKAARVLQGELSDVLKRAQTV
jgi:hypothetical protein